MWEQMSINGTTETAMHGTVLISFVITTNLVGNQQLFAFHAYLGITTLSLIACGDGD